MGGKLVSVQDVAYQHWARFGRNFFRCLLDNQNSLPFSSTMHGFWRRGGYPWITEARGGIKISVWLITSLWNLIIGQNPSCSAFVPSPH